MKGIDPTTKRMVEMSEGAYRVLCGLVQPADEVESDGIFAAPWTWEELRETFPVVDFREFFPDQGDDEAFLRDDEDGFFYYDGEAGT